MKWNYLSVSGKEGIECAGCDSIVHDLIFFPKDWDSEEARHLQQALNAEKQKLDPYTLCFCPDCMHAWDKGHKEGRTSEQMFASQRAVGFFTYDETDKPVA
jgi:hypothetical protein